MRRVVSSYSKSLNSLSADDGSAKVTVAGLVVY
jgi:hypothetical protein